MAAYKKKLRIAAGSFIVSVMFLFSTRFFNFGEWVNNFYPCTPEPFPGDIACFFVYDLVGELLAALSAIVSVVYALIILNNAAIEKRNAQHHHD